MYVNLWNIITISTLWLLNEFSECANLQRFIMASDVKNRLLLILQYAAWMQAVHVHYGLKVKDKTSMQVWLWNR
jgi:hypothetical protein